MEKIARNLRNYYMIVTLPHCTVFLDESLMKKANKILCKYQNEMTALLENNKEHLIEQEWSLCYPDGKQTAFYSSNKVDEGRRLLAKFETLKVKDIFTGIPKYKIHDENICDEVKTIMEGKVL